MKQKNRRTFIFPKPVSIISNASTAGPKEGNGPLGGYFDIVEQDTHLGEKTWEKAESRMQNKTLTLALEKIGMKPEEITAVLAGDLNNQCIGSAYGMRGLNIPYIGLYGACSNMAEGMVSASIMLNSELMNYLAVVTSSHFSTAERQFRYPLSYGGQRTMAAQWTCTASGAVILSSEKTDSDPKITACCIGIINDLGITDLSNMGAAMAPAAADTISSFLIDTNQNPEEFDAIITGDLGYVGSNILYDLLKEKNIDIKKQHYDCGKIIFDPDKQDTHAGGSGCGCSASVFCGYFMKKLRENKMKNILFSATGALMSPLSIYQGESIPGICHLIQVKNR